MSSRPCKTARADTLRREDQGALSTRSGGERGLELGVGAVAHRLLSAVLAAAEERLAIRLGFVWDRCKGRALVGAIAEGRVGALTAAAEVDIALAVEVLARIAEATDAGELEWTVGKDGDGQGIGHRYSTWEASVDRRWALSGRRGVDVIKYIGSKRVFVPMLTELITTLPGARSAIDLFSSDAARPTMARITPNPVPAMPKPTTKDKSWCASGVVANAVRTRPSA